MNHSRLFRLMFLIFFLLSGAPIVFAQNAQVTGRVVDQAGAVVPRAEVTITNQQTGLTRNAVSNDEGYFTILYLPPGQYRIEVKGQGFKPVIRPDVTLNVDQIARLDFSLEPGGVSEALTITSSAPLLNKETPAVGTVVENKLVEELPRSFDRRWRNASMARPGGSSLTPHGPAGFRLWPLRPVDIANSGLYSP